MSTKNAQSLVSIASESHVYGFLFSVTGSVQMKQRQGRFEAGIPKNEISAPLQISDSFDLKSKKTNIRPSALIQAFAVPLIFLQKKFSWSSQQLMINSSSTTSVTRSLTPWYTSVSSKNISPDPYYCHSRALAVTSGVKCTCSPAVNRCTPTAFPERITALHHRG